VRIPKLGRHFEHTDRGKISIVTCIRNRYSIHYVCTRAVTNEKNVDGSWAQNSPWKDLFFSLYKPKPPDPSPFDICIVLSQFDCLRAFYSFLTFIDKDIQDGSGYSVIVYLHFQWD
jgi:hypothetical protein